MRVVIFIIVIGGALYYWLYGVGPLRQFVMEQLMTQKAEKTQAVAVPNAEERKVLASLKVQHWKASYRSPPACQYPGTELKKLECKNMEDNAWQAFDRKWENDIALGWRPK
jgi:hypothetical protein